jgi:hypothetical protein
VTSPSDRPKGESNGVCIAHTAWAEGTPRLDENGGEGAIFAVARGGNLFSYRRQVHRVVHKYTETLFSFLQIPVNLKLGTDAEGTGCRDD